MILANPNHSLQIVLAGAVTTNQPTFVLNYDFTPDMRSNSVPQPAIYGSTTDTTPVVILNGPAKGAFIITSLTVYNADTATISATISLMDVLSGIATVVAVGNVSATAKAATDKSWSPF